MSNKTENSQSKTAGLEKDTPLEADAESNVTYCEICNIRLTSHGTYLEHVAGKKHKKKAGVIWKVPAKTKKESTEYGNPNKMTSQDKFSKHSSQDSNIQSHMNQRNEPKFQKRKSFSRYFDDNADYPDYRYDSGNYRADDSVYENHPYYGYYDERPYHSSRSYRFQSDQNVFSYRKDGFDQRLNKSGKKASNRQTSRIEIDLTASSDDSAPRHPDASETDILVSKSKLSGSPKHPSNSKSSSSFKSPSNSKSPSNPKSSTSKSPSNSKSSRSPLNAKPSFSFKSPPNSSRNKPGDFKSPKSASPFNKIENLKKQFCSPETSKVSEVAGGEKVEEQKLADKVAHNATRFVYPSTQKDKAVVGHLLHQLHRSKKKQNLTRLKIQSGCLEITDRNSVSKENLNSDSVHDDGNSVTSGDPLCHTASEELGDQSNKPEEVGMDTDSEMRKKRKRNNSQSKSRKKGCSDVCCFDDTIDQVLNTASQSESSSRTQNSALSPVSDSSNLQHLLLPSSFSQNKFIEDLLSSETEIRVKDEPLDTYEEQPKSSELQTVALPLAISSVDSLIDLFASGSVKVKQEFDDPLIDVIKSVDPSVLVKACEHDPAMKQMSDLIESNFLNQAYQTNVVKRPIVSPDDAVRSSVSDAPDASSSQSNLLCDKNESQAGIVERSTDRSERSPESICSFDPAQRPVVQPDYVGSHDPVNRLDVSQPEYVDSRKPARRPDVSQSEFVGSRNTIQRPECADSPNLAQRPDISQPECPNPIRSPDISRPELIGSHDLAQRPDISLTPTVSEGVMNSHREQDVVSKTSESFPKEAPVLIKTECDKGAVPHMEDLVAELKILSSMETDVKKNLLLADEKIAEHLKILEEWKSKKLQYQKKEEELRIKRNNVIQLMQVVLGTAIPGSSEISSNSCVENVTDNATKSNAENTTQRYSVPDDRKDVAVNMIDHHSFEEKNDALGSEPDVCILDPVVKDDDFPVIDLEVENQERISDTMSVSKHNMVTNIVASSKKKIFDLKSFPAHQTVVNYLKVHGGYLYTCCNDSTAKRFCLNNVSEVITYSHGDKNVSQLCVHRASSRFDCVPDQVILFTLCSGNNIVSMFSANEGKLLKTYHHINKITCICTGWNLCYIALAGGSVISLNLKEEQEIIKSQSGSLVRMATAHQGGIGVLVTLTVSGVISIHHAVTGLLIRCLRDVLKPPAHMSVHNDAAFFGGLDAISVLNISTGQIERKIPLSGPVTGLAIDKDHIFTSTFRGAIQCYSINHERNMKPLDVANFKAVTCIDVYQDWVFVGNRNGEISVVKFSAGQQNDFEERNN